MKIGIHIDVLTPEPEPFAFPPQRYLVEFAGSFRLKAMAAGFPTSTPLFEELGHEAGRAQIRILLDLTVSAATADEVHNLVFAWLQTVDHTIPELLPPGTTVLVAEIAKVKS